MFATGSHAGSHTDLFFPYPEGPQELGEVNARGWWKSLKAGLKQWKPSWQKRPDL